jgi:hypothetical protein
MPAGNKKSGHPTDGENPEEKDVLGMHTAMNDEADEAAVVLDERTRAELGRHLAKYYSQLVSQPVPDQFLDLLKKLDRKERGE